MRTHGDLRNFDGNLLDVIVILDFRDVADRRHRRLHKILLIMTSAHLFTFLAARIAF